MAYPFNPNNLRRATPPPLPPAASPRWATFAALARVVALWSLLCLGLAGGGAAVVWLVTSPDDIDEKILTLTGRGRP